MSTPSTDGLKQEIDAGRMRVGNEVQDQNGLPITTSVKQLYVDAGSDFQVSDAAIINQPTLTGEVFNVTGIPNGNIMTQTIVANASATTATAQGWLRINVVSSNSAIFSTSAYYIPLVSLT